MNNTELMHRAMRLIAASSETLRDGGKEKRIETVVLLAATAKVIYDDMTGMLTDKSGPGALEAKVDLVAAEVRREMERMYVDGWVKQ